MSLPTTMDGAWSLGHDAANAGKDIDNDNPWKRTTTPQYGAWRDGFSTAMIAISSDGGCRDFCR